MKFNDLIINKPILLKLQLANSSKTELLNIADKYKIKVSRSNTASELRAIVFTSLRSSFIFNAILSGKEE